VFAARAATEERTMANDSEYLWNPDAPMRQYLDPKIRRKKDPVSTFAQDTYAAVTKDQWYSYLNEIGVPQEMALQKFATDPSVVTNAMAEAGQDVNQAFDRQQVANQRNLSSLGLTLSPDEQVAADRSTNLSRSLADVNAQNMARRSTRALQQSVLGSPAPMIGEQP
jgi:hypothetical protein